MPNKAYWNLVEDILNTTSTICKPATEQKDEDDVACLLADIEARKEDAPDAPSKEITLAGLAAEFVETVHETCENYRSAETAEERQKIMDEVKDVTQDVFGCITNEFAEVFGEINKRLEEISKEDDDLFE